MGTTAGGPEGSDGDNVGAGAVDTRGQQPAVVFHALPRAHDRYNTPCIVDSYVAAN